jgi:hypothetical protein
MKTRNGLGAFSAIVILLVAGAASPAHAQATRTWVSGVGDDVNPCSRTAPCKTFAGAISKTAAKGEINVLDPGGFGAVTITKSITIASDGVEAGVLANAANAINVSVGVNDYVILRGLDIEGLGTAATGVRFNSGGALNIEDCTINGFASAGIHAATAGTARLIIKNTMVRNGGASGGGIHLIPTGGSLAVSIDGVTMSNNKFGLRNEGRTTVTVRDSVAASNLNNGFITVSSGQPALLRLENSVTTNHPGFGIRAEGSNATVILSNVTISDNANGISAVTGAVILSFGNNKNSDNGAPTGPIAPQ